MEVCEEEEEEEGAVPSDEEVLFDEVMGLTARPLPKGLGFSGLAGSRTAVKSLRFLGLDGTDEREASTAFDRQPFRCAIKPKWSRLNAGYAAIGGQGACDSGGEASSTGASGAGDDGATIGETAAGVSAGVSANEQDVKRPTPPKKPPPSHFCTPQQPGAGKKPGMAKPTSAQSVQSQVRRPPPKPVSSFRPPMKAGVVAAATGADGKQPAQQVLSSWPQFQLGGPKAGKASAGQQNGRWRPGPQMAQTRFSAFGGVGARPPFGAQAQIHATAMAVQQQAQMAAMMHARCQASASTPAMKAKAAVAKNNSGGPVTNGVSSANEAMHSNAEEELTKFSTEYRLSKQTEEALRSLPAEAMLSILVEQRRDRNDGGEETGKITNADGLEDVVVMARVTRAREEMFPATGTRPPEVAEVKKSSGPATDPSLEALTLIPRFVSENGLSPKVEHKLREQPLRTLQLIMGTPDSPTFQVKAAKGSAVNPNEEVLRRIEMHSNSSKATGATSSESKESKDPEKLIEKKIAERAHGLALGNRILDFVIKHDLQPEMEKALLMLSSEKVVEILEDKAASRFPDEKEKRNIIFMTMVRMADEHVYSLIKKYSKTLQTESGGDKEKKKSNEKRKQSSPSSSRKRSTSGSRKRRKKSKSRGTSGRRATSSSRKEARRKSPVNARRRDTRRRRSPSKKRKGRSASRRRSGRHPSADKRSRRGGKKSSSHSRSRSRRKTKSHARRRSNSRRKSASKSTSPKRSDRRSRDKKSSSKATKTPATRGPEIQNKDSFKSIDELRAMASSTGAKAAPKLGVDTCEYVRELLTRLYTEHNPQKIGLIDFVMKKYAGQEIEMYERVCQKYKVAPAYDGGPHVKLEDLSKQSMAAGTVEAQEQPLAEPEGDMNDEDIINGDIGSGEEQPLAEPEGDMDVEDIINGDIGSGEEQPLAEPEGDMDVEDIINGDIGSGEEQPPVEPEADMNVEDNEAHPALVQPQNENEEKVWDWLNGLDNGRGALLQYFDVLRNEFDADFSQIGAARLPSPTSSGILQALDPSFFEVVGVASTGHRLLLAKGILALPQ
eukprot:TRINITY_DN5179_c0_g1_i2.p1 TRINITY_DN5179_c0_g1~~TRINITY_DN5179_c0_g1_i2.p1  ORF type:complete len:1063 (+),score=265.08 TRINITY_DN5179_c0_g1_i2:46-3234(+)